MSREIGLAIAGKVEAPCQTRPGAGCFQIAVLTVFPRHSTSRGSPTLTETYNTQIWRRSKSRGPLLRRSIA